MTILGRGDLSPPRRPPRRARSVVTTVVVVAVIAAAAWFGWHAWRGSSRSRTAATPRPCATPSVPPTPAAPAQVTVAVLNTTTRVGLAHDVAAQLRTRGFHVAHVGNTTPLIAGPAEVTYGDGLQAQALAVAEQVRGATMAPAGSGVTLRIGTAFRALSAGDAVAAARAHDLAAAAPRRPVCTSP